MILGYLGDFRRSGTVHAAWSSFNSSGASVTRATNGTISVYKDAGTTQSTTGVTDTEDFDAVTGVHWVTIDLSADTSFYSAGSNFTIVLSGATIDSQTVASVIGAFSIENRFRGQAFRQTAQGGGPQAITLHAGASASDDAYNGWIIETVSGLGSQQNRVVTDYNGTTKVATLDRAWVTEPDGTTVFDAFPGSLAVSATEIVAEMDSSIPNVNVSQWNGTTVAAPDTAGYPSVTIKSGTGTGEVSLSSGLVKIQQGTGAGQLDTSSGQVKVQSGTGGGQISLSSGTVTVGAFSNTGAEQASRPADSATISAKIDYLLSLQTNKRTFNKTTGAVVIRNRADSGSIGTATDTDDGTTYTGAAIT